MTAAAVFSFGDLGILVESAEASHLVWLAEFLGPPFAVKAEAAYGCRVLLVEDRERYDAALAAGQGAGALDAFALDRAAVSLPRWRGAEARLFDAQWEVFYDVAAAPLAITILSVPGNLKSRTALMRVVRELATNHAQRAGGLLLHASAFASRGGGVLIAGPKGAGKTTLLLHALRAPAVEYMSNDRVMVGLGAVPTARGVPTIVKVRPPTLALLPALAETLAAAAYYQRLTLEEAAARAKPAADEPSDPRLSQAQLCRVLAVRACAECQVAAIIFPTLTGEPGPFTLERLSTEAVERRLPTAFFGVRAGRWCSDVFTLAGPSLPDAGALVARGRALAQRVPGFECRLGLNAYDSARSADDLVGALLG